MTPQEANKIYLEKRNILRDKIQEAIDYSNSNGFGDVATCLEHVKNCNEEPGGIDSILNKLHLVS